MVAPFRPWSGPGCHPPIRPPLPRPSPRTWGRRCSGCRIRGKSDLTHRQITAWMVDPELRDRRHRPRRLGQPVRHGLPRAPDSHDRRPLLDRRWCSPWAAGSSAPRSRSPCGSTAAPRRHRRPRPRQHPRPRRPWPGASSITTAGAPSAAEPHRPPCSPRPTSEPLDAGAAGAMAGAVPHQGADGNGATSPRDAPVSPPRRDPRGRPVVHPDPGRRGGDLALRRRRRLLLVPRRGHPDDDGETTTFRAAPRPPTPTDRRVRDDLARLVSGTPSTSTPGSTSRTARCSPPSTSSTTTSTPR